MQDEVKLALEHAWRHFQLHAQQRISVFNFFVATTSLLVAGLAFTLQASRGIWPLGLAAGLLLMLLALVFWKLDARVSDMIKSSEDIIAQAEEQLIGDARLRAVWMERAITTRTQFAIHKAWTYGQAFRRIFLIMAVIGLCGSIWSVFQAFPPAAGPRAPAAAVPCQR
jgi:hypothetical protein